MSDSPEQFSCQKKLFLVDTQVHGANNSSTIYIYMHKSFILTLTLEQNISHYY